MILLIRITKTQMLLQTQDGNAREGNTLTTHRKQKAKIARFAIDNGNSRAAKHFSESMGRKINESTIRSFKAAYHFRKAESGKDIIVAIDSKKCCRPKLLPEPIDKEICEYIKDLRNAGGIVNSIIVQSVAKGIILDSDQSLLTENGGHVELTKD